MAPAREPATLGREAVSAREPVTHDHDAVTERLPGRPRQQPAAPHRGEMPPAARPDTTATPPAGEPSLAMLASLATGPTMVPDDDPLTSPSFSRPAADSRSYRTARRSPQPGDTANGAHLDGPTAAAHYSNGYADDGYAAADHADVTYARHGGTDDHAQANGAYQFPSYDDPGSAYMPAAPATPPAGAPQPADWYSAPAHPPSQGNPYGSYVEAAQATTYPSIPPSGYRDEQPGADFPGYPGDHAGYQEPAYGAPAQMPYPAPVAATARPAGHAGPGHAGPSAHPSDGGQFPQPAAYPAAGYPEEGGYGNGYAGRPPYADGYGNGHGGSGNGHGDYGNGHGDYGNGHSGYGNGHGDYGSGPGSYPPGYPAADYAADQYGQADYDGYPTDQG
jgi:hypothetical protein